MANKDQKAFADKFFKDNPNAKELYLNKRGEFFTDKNWCENSLQKDKDGKKETYETLKKGEN